MQTDKLPTLITRVNINPFRSYVETSSDILIFLFPTLFLIFNPFQSNFSATHILPSSYLFWSGKRLVDYLQLSYSFKREKQEHKEYNLRYLLAKSVIHEEKRREQQNHNVGRSPTLWFSCSRRFSSCSTDFSQQIAHVVFFLFLFKCFSLKTVG
jgi:hypothetical protein